MGRTRSAKQYRPIVMTYQATLGGFVIE